ncbi:hypothetical protein [Hymenobacter sp. GOD-10R]|uniref:hypothetical protein n=1 Tax=Hymenobacter sp. GOD-10R TaxID=3093922 RepID=UPI002D7724ED|nr:hypothetical protein [Hymenobacter sp. GOD-10R]WRQ29013.1 hypothetical protein SD425_01890 [Hymenobacter sp. GOD-10R]
MRIARVTIAIVVALATFFSLSALARHRRFGWDDTSRGYFGGRHGGWRTCASDVYGSRYPNRNITPPAAPPTRPLAPNPTTDAQQPQ